MKLYIDEVYNGEEGVTGNSDQIRKRFKKYVIWRNGLHPVTSARIDTITSGDVVKTEKIEQFTRLLIRKKKNNK